MPHWPPYVHLTPTTLHRHPNNPQPPPKSLQYNGQPVRSFKVRGAYNKMSRLTPAQLEKGVICSSAGNHAQVGRVQQG